jgi:hypothetical protein
MKGTYSESIAFASTAPATPQLAPDAAGATVPCVGKWRSTGWRWKKV